MNNRIIDLYNGITNIDDNLIEEALLDQEKDLTLIKNKNTATVKIVKILSVAASVVFIITVIFPILVANVSALEKIVKTYLPEYFNYSQNFAIDKPSVPEDNLDKIIYYSELSDFHDSSIGDMRGPFLDDVSTEEASALLQKAEDLLNAASKSPIAFLEYLGFAPDTYSYTVVDNYFKTDIAYSKVHDATLSYFTEGVFKAILDSYVINRFDKAIFPYAKNEDNTFKVTRTLKDNDNGFFTSIITSGEKTYSVYYGIASVNEEKVIGYYWCTNYDEYDIPIRNENDPIPEVNESDLEEMRAVATEYMIIRAKWITEPDLPVLYFGFSHEDTCYGEYIGSYQKTNVDYAEFYSKMLRIMTPQLFKREYSRSYIELDGKLCIIGGGASGWEFDEVLKLIPSENGYYKFVARWVGDYNELMEEEYPAEMYFEKTDNGWVVADYKTDKSL